MTDVYANIRALVGSGEDDIWEIELHSQEIGTSQEIGMLLKEVQEAVTRFHQKQEVVKNSEIVKETDV